MSTPTFAKTHNLIACLAKPTESKGFEQIIDFLNGSSEYAICHTLKLDDADGTSCLANAEIFNGLAKMGYEKLSEKLTFYRHYSINNHLSCYKIEVQLLKQPQAPKVPSPELSPEHRLPLPSNDSLLGGEDSLKLKELMDLCIHLSKKVLELESKVIDIKSTYKDRIEKLEGRVDKLEEENMNLKDLHSVHSKVDIAAPTVEKEKSFKQERIIAEIDEDVEINLEEAQAKLYRIELEHLKKVLSIQDVDDEEPVEVEEVLEVVKAAKLMT
nr:hypothetical protein [Tanacetum cinerariifolium]